MDVVTEVERLPEQGETILGEKVYFLPGGKGANQAVAAARLGAETTMIGAVGHDAFGQDLYRSLQESGVQMSAVQRLNDVKTGLANILLSEQDNRIIVVPGANHRLTPELIREEQNRIVQADVLLLQLEIPLQTVEEAIQIAADQTLVILNPAPAQDLPAALLQRIDYITPNETELAHLTGLSIANDHQLREAMLHLQSKGPKHVMTTLGKQGVAYLDDQQQLQKVPSYSVEVVDTTGAGDAFNGGLATALAEGKSLPDAIAFANGVSALAVTKLGAQTGMPTKEEVASFLAD
jgi:ribokinase